MRTIRGKICTSETSVCVTGKILCKRIRPLQRVRNKMTIFRSLFIVFYLGKPLQVIHPPAPFLPSVPKTSFIEGLFPPGFQTPYLLPQIQHLRCTACISIPKSLLLCIFPNHLSFPLHWCAFLSARAVLIPGSWFMGIFLSLARAVCVI